MNDFLLLTSLGKRFVYFSMAPQSDMFQAALVAMLAILLRVSEDTLSQFSSEMVCTLDHSPRAWRKPGLVTITQFYFVDFSQSRISVKKCIFSKRTNESRFA